MKKDSFHLININMNIDILPKITKASDCMTRGLFRNIRRRNIFSSLVVISSTMKSPDILEVPFTSISLVSLSAFNDTNGI